MTVPIDGSVAISGASAVTVMVSSTAATCIDASTTVVLPTLTIGLLDGELAEAAHGEGHFVGAGRQDREAVAAVGAGDGGAREAGGGVGRGDRHAGQGIGLLRGAALEVAAGGLRQEAGRRHQHRQHQRHRHRRSSRLVS